MPDRAFPAAADELRGYFATPSTPGPWPGVVVLHEAFGLNDDIRRHADRLAAAGYLVLAPDLYSYGFRPRCLLATFRTLFRGGGRTLQDIDAARDFLVAAPGCSGKVGVIGFCLGGGFAILAATRGFDAAAPNYGLVPSAPDRALAGSCAMVASYGADDRSLRGAAATLERALEANEVPHDVKEYPNAAHSFMSEYAGRWSVMERVNGLRFVPAAADDAWARILAFFSVHLAG